MKPSGSFLLVALGALLALGLGAWTLHLVISVDRDRRAMEDDLSVLIALAEVDEALDQVEHAATIGERDVPPRLELRPRQETVQHEVAEAIAAIRDTPVHQRLADEIEAAWREVLELAWGSVSDDANPGWRAIHAAAVEEARTRVASARQSVYRSHAAVAAQLRPTWRGVQLLALFSVVMVAMLVVMLWQARVAAAHRRLSEAALQQANEELGRRAEQRTALLVRTNHSLALEVAERVQAECLQSGRREVLERLAAGATLQEVLTTLVKTAEAFDPEMLCSVLLVDEDQTRLRLGSAPSLPDFYNEAIEGVEVGDGVGSCGTAAWTGRRVIVEDISTHPFWKDYRDVAEQAGLRACWSEPILSSTSEILGTFAIYYRQPRGPDEQNLQFIGDAAHLAGIAIERTRAEAALRDSQARLRVADRLACIGTLAAGLGHDMNNLLLPMRCCLQSLHLDSLSREDRQAIESTRTTVEYLQQICNGLRLLSADPDESGTTNVATDLTEWWGQFRPLLSSILPGSIRLELAMAEGLPAVGCASHQLTQAVLNLVMNAAEAAPQGTVTLSAEAASSGRTVFLRVCDDGPGMSEVVRLRAFDPFFTTKRRSLSTGLGLPLVRGIVVSCGGSVQIEPDTGGGTIVTIELPAVDHVRSKEQAPLATVSVRDGRVSAWMVSLLESAGYNVRIGEEDAESSEVWVTEADPVHLPAAQERSMRGNGFRTVVLGQADQEWRRLGATVVEDVNDFDALRCAVLGLSLAGVVR